MNIYDALFLRVMIAKVDEFTDAMERDHRTLQRQLASARAEVKALREILHTGGDAA